MLRRPVARVAMSRVSPSSTRQLQLLRLRAASTTTTTRTPATTTAETASSSVHDDHSASTTRSATATIDARTAEELRVAAALGERGFDENTRILKALALRGARALLVCGIGVVAFAYARRYRRNKMQHDEQHSSNGGDKDDDDNDPTQRYLNEMRSLGFDVDTLEEELAAERAAQAAAAAAQH